MIKIFTICYNTPQFVEYQYLLLKKFIEEDFEYIVYDNTCTNTKNGTIFISNTDNNNKNLLNKICDKYNIKVIAVPNHIYTAYDVSQKKIKIEYINYYPNYDISTRAGISISYACKNTINEFQENDICFLIDSDMFLLEKFSIKKHMENIDISGIGQNREQINYFTNQLFFFNLNNIDKENYKYINFMPRNIEGLDIDCGADLHFLLKKQPNLKIKYNRNFLFGDVSKNFFNKNPRIIEYFKRDLEIVRKSHRQDIGFHGEVYEGVFLHFRAGTNWRDGMKYSERTLNLFEFLDHILNINLNIVI